MGGRNWGTIYETLIVSFAVNFIAHPDRLTHLSFCALY